MSIINRPVHVLREAIALILLVTVAFIIPPAVSRQPQAGPYDPSGGPPARAYGGFNSTSQSPSLSNQQGSQWELDRLNPTMRQQDLSNPSESTPQQMKDNPSETQQPLQDDFRLRDKSR